jgi:hypothetical protein
VRTKNGRESDGYSSLLSSANWFGIAHENRTSLPDHGHDAISHDALHHPMVRLYGRFVEPLIGVRMALGAPVEREMQIVRPHGIDMTHNLRDSLHSWTLLFVDVNATMCQSWLPRGAA